MPTRKVTAKMRQQWRMLIGISPDRIAELWGVHSDTVRFHLWDRVAERRRQQWREYKHKAYVPREHAKAN